MFQNLPPLIYCANSIIKTSLQIKMERLTLCYIVNTFNQPFFLVLQLFLSSPRPTLRFAAVRTLNKVAIMQPQSVMVCNLDLENLITDVNRSIATLAITTLLKVMLFSHHHFKNSKLCLEEDFEVCLKFTIQQLEFP